MVLDFVDLKRGCFDDDVVILRDMLNVSNLFFIARYKCNYLLRHKFVVQHD